MIPQANFARILIAQNFAQSLETCDVYRNRDAARQVNHDAVCFSIDCDRRAAMRQSADMPTPRIVTAATDNKDASIIGWNWLLWAQVRSQVVSTGGCSGESVAVAVTSVSESAPTSKLAASSIGQASGKTTCRGSRRSRAFQSRDES